MAANRMSNIGEPSPGGMHPLEFELRRRLIPILPNPEYIQRLKAQLYRMPKIVVENKPKITGLMMILMGLFSSVLAIWIIRKISKQ